MSIDRRKDMETREWVNNTEDFLEISDDEKQRIGGKIIYQKICKDCGRILSVYNPNERCFCHTETILQDALK